LRACWTNISLWPDDPANVHPAARNIGHELKDVTEQRIVLVFRQVYDSIIYLELKIVAWPTSLVPV
jgi:hypothetical protein